MMETCGREAQRVLGWAVRGSAGPIWGEGGPRQLPQPHPLCPCFWQWALPFKTMGIHIVAGLLRPLANERPQSDLNFLTSFSLHPVFVLLEATRLLFHTHTDMDTPCSVAPGACKYPHIFAHLSPPALVLTLCLEGPS